MNKKYNYTPSRESSDPMSATTASLLPVDAPYTVATSLLAEAMGRAIGSRRHAESPVAIFVELLGIHQIALPEDKPGAQELGEMVLSSIMADTIYDSEQNQAARAVHTHLYELFGESLSVVGWIDGHRVSTDRGTLTLVGTTACDRCQINPLCYGEGYSGVRCLDVSGCGYWYCA